MMALRSQDLVQISFHRGDFPGGCRTSLALRMELVLSLSDCAERFEMSSDVFWYYTNKNVFIDSKLVAPEDKSFEQPNQEKEVLFTVQQIQGKFFSKTMKNMTLLVLQTH